MKLEGFPWLKEFMNDVFREVTEKWDDGIHLKSMNGVQISSEDLYSQLSPELVNFIKAEIEKERKATLKFFENKGELEKLFKQK